jgi:chemotaxis protein histidine kinase CheA
MEVLFLDFVEQEEGNAAPPRVRLAVRAYPSDAKGFVALTPECDTMEHFEQAVAELKESMAGMLQSAKEKFQRYQHQVKGETGVTDFHSVEEIWQALEECAAMEEMRELFNALSLHKRRDVADFVLTQLNIFKGAASRFSQHYNEEKYLLE